MPRIASFLCVPTLALTLALAACGGSVNHADPAANSGEAGGTTTSGSGGGSTTSTGQGGVGQGGATGTDCASITHLGPCLAAFPACAPVFDDACCPMCDPTGGCADCVDSTFHDCAPAAQVCSAPPPCGFVPDWACKGGQAQCEGALGSPTPCHAVAGCELAVPSDQGPTCEPGPCPALCSAITAGSCFAQCDGPTPFCDGATTPEANGTCWTGFCIPLEACGDATL